MRLAIPLVIAAILVLCFCPFPILTATIGIALPLKIMIAVVLLGTLGFFWECPSLLESTICRGKTPTIFHGHGL